MRRLIIVLTILLALGFVTGCSKEKNDIPENLPKISNEAITIAKEQIKGKENIKDAAIVVEANYVALAIVLEEATSSEEAKGLLLDFARVFADVTASFDNELKGSDGDFLGSIYDHYKLTLGAVAAGSEDLIAGGTKDENSDSVIWDEDNKERQKAMEELNKHSEKFKEK